LAHSSGLRAGFFRRFWAVFVDGIVLGLVAGVLQVIVGRTFGGVVALALYIGYAGYFEGSPSGQTIGKRALGIRVLDLRTGGSIGFSRAVLRYFAHILSGLPLFLGYFWMLWDPEKQTWHDKIAGSVVVPVSAFPVDTWPGAYGQSAPRAPHESAPSAQGEIEPPPTTEARHETLEEEQQRKFDEREKQWGGG
jgi:uncharacterized RDD family membrane protein YckC